MFKCKMNNCVHIKVYIIATKQQTKKKNLCNNHQIRNITTQIYATHTKKIKYIHTYTHTIVCIQ